MGQRLPQFRRDAARQSEPCRWLGFLCTVAIQQQHSRVRACDLIPTYHTGGAALSCCRPPISQGNPISMVCSRSGVRLYVAALRSGPGLLCAAARFVSAKQQGNDGCSRWQGFFLIFFLDCCGMNSFLLATQSFSPQSFSPHR